MTSEVAYQSTIHFRRTPEEKADQRLSWLREDKAFFAAGACHILAYAFLEIHPGEDYQIIYIHPKAGYHGNHVYVSKGNWAFDYSGWTLESELTETTIREYSSESPGWGYDRIVLAESLEEFCLKNDHRLPQNYYSDVWARAITYIEKFTLTPPNI